jgi:hypothetical protein
MSAALRRAIRSALAGRWDEAHALVQADPGALAARIHAELHRIEGDADNAAYWYRRAGVSQPSQDAQTALAQILAELGPDPG